ncbi:MAG: ABC transporter ATP-binding protein/permease [Clostridiales bacterium]|nr:ABC transporter ATP-binding protein/permease [Clostridiales bacterium]
MNKGKNALWWIYSYSKTKLLWVLCVAGISGIISVCYVFLALASKNILDIATGDKTGSIALWALVLCGIIGFQAFLNVLGSNIRIRAMGKIEISIKQGVFKKLLKKKYISLSAYHTGEIVNRMSADITVVINGIVDLLPVAVSIATQIVSGFIVLIYIDAKFTLVVIAVGVILFIAGRIYAKHFKYLHKEVQTSDGVIRSFIQEIFENIIVIKSFSNFLPVSGRLMEKQLESYKIKLKRNTVGNIANTGVYVLFTASYYGALIWGAFKILAGTITFGTLTAFLQVIDQVRSPMKNMSSLIPSYYSMIASAERLMELEAMEDEELSPCNIKYEDIEAIEIDNLTFGYGEKELIFDGAFGSIDKNSLTTVIGPSGEGKSTLLKLILGIIEPKSGGLYFKTKRGRVKIDGGFRELFAYVPQGNMVLSGSLRDNIRFFNEETADEKIIEAAKTAQIYDLTEELKDGLDTVIGERGFGLSEGQVQRISIARAILSDTPILLLDEATSALDAETEERLLKAITGLENKTCIFVSHKEAAVSCCDKILKVTKGKISEVENV